MLDSYGAWATLVTVMTAAVVGPKGAEFYAPGLLAWSVLLAAGWLFIGARRLLARKKRTDVAG